MVDWPCLFVINTISHMVSSVVMYATNVLWADPLRCKLMVLVFVDVRYEYPYFLSEDIFVRRACYRLSMLLLILVLCQYNVVFDFSSDRL
jgi:hypothetical protein